MPFNTTSGIYTPASGAESAAAGKIIASATWNAIFTDLSTGLTQLGQGTFAPPTVALALVNGLNSNVTLPTQARNRITGPSAAFSVGGFTGGTDGVRLYLYNSTSQTMTIVNEDASSTATNRIHTLNGQNLILASGSQSYVTMSYDGTDSRWIVESDRNTQASIPSSAYQSVYTLPLLSIPLSVTSDNSISIVLPPGVTTYAAQSVRVANVVATAPLAAPAIALYTASGGSGVALIASTSISVVAASTVVAGVSVAGNTLLVNAVGSTSPATNVSSVFLRVVVPASISSTADFLVQIVPLY